MCPVALSHCQRVLSLPYPLPQPKHVSNPVYRNVIFLLYEHLFQAAEGGWRTGRAAVASALSLQVRLTTYFLFLVSGPLQNGRLLNSLYYSMFDFPCVTDTRPQECPSWKHFDLALTYMTASAESSGQESILTTGDLKKYAQLAHGRLSELRRDYYGSQYDVCAARQTAFVLPFRAARSNTTKRIASPCTAREWTRENFCHGQGMPVAQSDVLGNRICVCACDDDVFVRANDHCLATLPYQPPSRPDALSKGEMLFASGDDDALAVKYLRAAAANECVKPARGPSLRGMPPPAATLADAVCMRASARQRPNRLFMFCISCTCFIWRCAVQVRSSVLQHAQCHG